MPVGIKVGPWRVLILLWGALGGIHLALGVSFGIKVGPWRVLILLYWGHGGLYLGPLGAFILPFGCLVAFTTLRGTRIIHFALI